jgi:hypothetical protein
MSILLTKRVVESLRLKLRYIPFGLVPLSYVYLHGGYDIGKIEVINLCSLSKSYLCG